MTKAAPSFSDMVSMLDAHNRRRPKKLHATHAGLVDVAVRWLRTTVNCGVVLREHQTSNEFPDAIGWRGGFSYMVECKVSRADFFADQKKKGRVDGRRLAWRCYYLTLPGLLSADEIPDKWGLLELGARGRVRIVKEVPEQIRHVDDRGDIRDELYILYSELRRYQLNRITYPKLLPPTERRRLAVDRSAEVREARQIMGLEARA